MLDIFKNLLSAIASLLKIKARDQELKNSPDMQDNARAAQNAKIRDTAVAAVKTNDLDAIRKQAAE